MHIKIPLQDGNLKEKAVFRLVHPLLEGLGTQRLDKFVRVLIRVHMKNPRGYPRRFQHRNRPKRRLDAGSVAVVGQDDLIRITLQKAGMLRRQGGSQRCY